MESTTIPLPFVGGIQQGAAAEYVDPGTNQSDIVNCNLTKLGGAYKRRGFAGLNTTILSTWNPKFGFAAANYALNTAKRVQSTKRNGSLIFSNSALYSYDGESPAGLNVLGLVPNVAVKRRVVPSPPLTTTVHSCDFGADSRLVVSTIGGGPALPYATVISRSTGQVLVPQQVIPGASSVQPFFTVQAVFKLGTKIAIIGAQVPVANVVLALVVYDPATGLFAAPVSLGPSLPNTGVAVWDACPVINDPANGFLLLLGIDTASPIVPGPGSGTVTLYSFGPTGALLHTAVVDASFGAAGIKPFVYCEYGAAEHIWVGYMRQIAGPNMQYVVWSAPGDLSWSSSVTNNITTVPVGCFLSPIIRTAASRAWQCILQPVAGVTQTDPTSVTFYGIQYRLQYNTAAPLSQTPWPFGYLPVGKPLVDTAFSGIGGERVIIPAARSLYFTSTAIASHIDDTLYLLRCSNEYRDGAVPIATSLQRQLSTFQLGSFSSPNWAPGWSTPFMSTLGSGGVLPASAAIHAATLYEDVTAGRVSSSSGTILQSVEYTFSQDQVFKVGELGDGAHIQSSVPYRFDGQGVFEDSFFFTPLGTFATVVAGAGGVAGTWSIAVIYRWLGADGQEHKSAPWIVPAPLVTALNQKIKLEIPVYAGSARNDIACVDDGSGNPVTANRVFADIYLTDSLGSTYYLNSSIDVTPKFLPSNPSDGYVGVTLSPATGVPQSTLLYTTGNRLDNVNPPAARCMTTHKNRVFIVDDTGQTVWMTQAFVQGDACGWNEDLTFAVPDGGDVNAIESLDDKLVLFKSDSIYVVYGDGPDVSGNGSDLTIPQRIASDVGCIDWRSVALTPEGLVFRAAAGVYLLDRGLNVTYIGKAVEDLLASATILGAVLVPADQQVRFLLSTGSVAYDYLHHAWVRHSYDQAGSALTSACRFGEAMLMCTANGRVLLERTANWLDQDAGGVDHFVSRHIVMPWLKYQGIQGYQQLGQLLFFSERKSSYGLRFTLAANYDTTPKQILTYTSDQLSGTRNRLIFHASALIAKQESLQVTIDEVAPAVLADTGEGGAFVEFRAELRQISAKYALLKQRSAFHVDAVTPSTGAVGGGTAVTISGAGFFGASAVTFVGAGGASSIIVVDDSTITCVTPGGILGPVDVSVTTPRGTRTLTAGFTYVAVAPPTLTSVLSNVGAWAVGDIDGGYQANLVGTNFVVGSTSVTFGGVAATSVVVTSTTTLTCIAPAHAFGAVSVIVTTPNGSNVPNTLWTYYSPAQENLTGWWRGDFAVPWTPKVSAGVSGTNGSLVTTGANPAAGAAVSGHVPAAYGGTSQLDAANTETAYLAVASGSIFQMAKVNTNAVAPAANTYDDVALLNDANGAVQMRYNTSGFSCTIFDGIAYQPAPYIGFTLAAWHLFFGSWDGTHVNGGVDGSALSSALAGNAGVAAVALHTGTNYNGAAHANADLMETITMATTATPTQRLNIRAYMTTRYGQGV